MNKISILGCGWIGKPLAAGLVQRGKQVQGSTTTPEKVGSLQVLGIEACLLDVQQKLWPDSFFDTELLVIAMPPSRGSEVYPETVRQALASIPAATKIILLSSTSVYISDSEQVDELSAIKSIQENSICLVESMIQASKHEYAIVRLGGLMGYERNLKRFFAHKTAMHNRPVNYIHQDDVLAFLIYLIENSAWLYQVYNLVAPLHPTTREIYQAIAPEKAQQISWHDSSNKIVVCSHLPEGFKFAYPDPRLMFDDVAALEGKLS